MGELFVHQRVGVAFATPHVPYGSARRSNRRRGLMATFSPRFALGPLASLFQPSTREWPIMPPAFVVTFAVLMVWGPIAAMAAAAAAALTPDLLAARFPR